MKVMEHERSTLQILHPPEFYNINEMGACKATNLVKTAWMVKR